MADGMGAEMLPGRPAASSCFRPPAQSSMALCAMEACTISDSPGIGGAVWVYEEQRGGLRWKGGVVGESGHGHSLVYARFCLSPPLKDPPPPPPPE